MCGTHVHEANVTSPLLKGYQHLGLHKTSNTRLRSSAYPRPSAVMQLPTKSLSTIALLLLSALGGGAVQVDEQAQCFPLESQ